ncbi:MAG: hypothetical protein R3E56_03170 [Burkholderiaceae bacterium]
MKNPEAPSQDTPSEMELEALRRWRELLSTTPRQLRETVAHVVREGSEPLADEFYKRMLRHARAGRFLDQAQVKKGFAPPCGAG